MPVTKTAKRALRSSNAKRLVNNKILTQVEVGIRKAKSTPSAKNIENAISAIDMAAKKKIFHKNKAARLKSQVSKLQKPKSQKQSSKKR